MPTMAYIEDDTLRLSILVGQPSGVACLKAGVLDVFLDRRLTRDDGRGLGQGVMDNRETTSLIQFLFESTPSPDRTSLTGYPTLLAHRLSIRLLYPLHVFHSAVSKFASPELHLFSKPARLPRDYHLVNLRSLTQHDGKTFALILRRFAYDCGTQSDHHDRVRCSLSRLHRVDLRVLFLATLPRSV